MPPNDPDIRNEPHLRPGNVDPNLDPAIDTPLGFNSAAIQFSPSSEEDIDHSVWDEPSLTPAVSASVPDSALTYANWLSQRRESWTQWQAWTVTLGVVLLSVPLAAIAAVISLFSGNQFFVTDVILACIAGPIIQEIFKIMVPLWIVEKRPYFFTTWFQFFVFALVSATVFAAVSNFFLSLAVKEVTRSFFLFQWVGILGLNLITASIATHGLETIWRNTINSGKPPKLDDGYPWFATAIGLHILFAAGTTIWFVVNDLGKFFFL
ncbi:hypothetical protein [Mariniblastus fucicola]|uniref:Uncharacterized protein n=1 Tax=Mariniblastus fucicola TaxID=980251 RepID=A0A5B9P7F7_9BACT|nr:hypothetical protein [Mariniblastus fucicola]QEG22577.1 hypothetical protein MFFC18_24600 [Mariniblastus fucicola]